MGPLHESAQEDPEEEAAIRARQLEGMRRENYGFRKVEVRAGNMGYLRLAGFRAIKGVVSGTVRDEEP